MKDFVWGFWAWTVRPNLGQVRPKQQPLALLGLNCCLPVPCLKHGLICACTLVLFGDFLCFLIVPDIHSKHFYIGSHTLTWLFWKVRWAAVPLLSPHSGAWLTVPRCQIVRQPCSKDGPLHFPAHPDAEDTEDQVAGRWLLSFIQGTWFRY